MLQYLLVANKISVKTDGNFGPKTLAALKAFQVQQNILVTDATDAQTWTRLATDVTASSPKDQIRALQAALRNNGYKLPISGVLDTATIDFIAKSRADSGSTSTGTFTVADWLTLVGTGD